MFDTLSPSSVALLSGATLTWILCWAADVTSTVRGIRKAGGNVSWESNPVARFFMQRLSMAGALGVLFGIEASLVGLHWVVAAYPLVVESSVWVSAGVALVLVVQGLAHALAAWSNHTGRVARVLVPMIRLYGWMGRRMGVR